ncbi:hypothetical protein JOC78_001540 [Bacillus ectoiniformans]|uniref:hypothetical protein n=1 Tax=Bacillus ectoiniformans TaxID=1494429 RepID=UPI00195E7046|nr:hypothetical protein [Bacillus ectoiniformans]MBM7648594.1 hypothetical protein [Bacillus ectoiniformans]
MKKLSWALSAIGVLLILSSLLYPLNIIEKSTFTYLLLGGALIMFIGSMIRTYAILKK